jgi:hypothetical protein
MSGRYTFTAGNTLTAAELNTNIMDGVLYKQQVGTGSVTMTAGGGGANDWSTGSLNITNLSGFTVQPYVVATAESPQGTNFVGVHVNVTSTTAFTIYCFYYGNSSTSRTVRWVASQAQSGTAAGS